jgi:diguanylate cyclase (GGDEF)-like protein
MGREEIIGAIGRALKNASPQHPVLLICVNTDEFSRVNDFFGYSTGDRLLTEICARLASICATGDTLGRIHSDEFVLILHPSDADEGTEHLLGRIAHSLDPCFMIGGLSLSMSTAIGGIMVTGEGISPGELLGFAKQAMLQVKAGARKSPYLADQEMVRLFTERNKIAAMIQEGLDERRFFLLYQPILDAASGEIVGAEALLRLRSADGTVFSASDMLESLKKTRLHESVDQWVIEEAVHEFQECLSTPALDEKFRISLNLGTDILSKPGYGAQWLQLVAKAGIAPKRFGIEISAETLSEKGTHLLENLRILNVAGMEIILDRFGMEPIDLRGLPRFPIDTVKIFSPILQGLLPGHESESDSLRALLRLTRMFGWKIIASGIETKEMHDQLAPVGCDRIQGFLHGDPLPLRDLTSMLTGTRALPLYLPTPASPKISTPALATS